MTLTMDTPRTETSRTLPLASLSDAVGVILIAPTSESWDHSEEPLHWCTVWICVS